MKKIGLFCSCLAVTITLALFAGRWIGDSIGTLIDAANTPTYVASKPVYQHLMDSTVVVFGKNGSFGTGFTVIKDDAAYVITASHVVAELRTEDDKKEVKFEPVSIGRIIYENNKVKKRETCNAQFVRYSDVEHQDIAVLVLDKKDFARDSLEFRTDDPPIMTRVILCSTPLSPIFAYTMSLGLVSGVDRDLLEDKDRVFYQLNITAGPGSSGSAVCREVDGKVVGMMTRGANESICFATPISRLVKWMDEAKADFLYNPEKSPTLDEVKKEPIELPVKEMPKDEKNAK